MVATLNDGTTIALPSNGLVWVPPDRLYVVFDGGRRVARFLRHAYHALGEYLEEAEAAASGVELRVGSESHPVALAESTPSGHLTASS